jgi:nucleoside-diphosphate-sugar epimerase
MQFFVTGASGWIGSAVVPELLAHGHQVVGLARSEASAARVEAAGATALRATLDDHDVLRDAAAASDGVIHLGYKHELAFSPGGFGQAALADRVVVELLGDALAAGTPGRPLVICSGTAGLTPGVLGTEDDRGDPDAPASPRLQTEDVARGFADRGVRSAVVRLPPTVHGDGDHGFVAMVAQVARDRGVSAYIGDGANRWPAVHRSDAARLFRLVAEAGEAGATWHGVGEEGVPARAIAQSIGRGLNLPVESIDPDEAAEHFGWLAAFFGLDVPASSARTQEILGWTPSGPTLVEDLDAGHYTRATVAG